MTVKKLDAEGLKTLKGNCLFLFDKMDEHSRELREHMKKMPQKAFVIASAYALSSIYSCYEDMFKHIAGMFENKIDNLSSWHIELLKRMLIAVPGVRPAVLSEEEGAVLDEMRAFRHVFRSSYVFVIDAERVATLAAKWNGSKKKLRKEIEKFLSKVGA